MEDLAIDSLDLVDVVLQIQDEFDIAIEDDDVPNLRRVADLAMYVAARRGRRPPNDDHTDCWSHTSLGEGSPSWFGTAERP